MWSVRRVPVTRRAGAKLFRVHLKPVLPTVVFMLLLLDCSAEMIDMSGGI